MHSAAAAPFFIAAISQICCACLSRLLDIQFKNDYDKDDQLVQAEHPGKYNPPPFLESGPLRARITRDMDVLSAVTFAATTIGTALVSLDTSGLIFKLVLGIGILAPAILFASILAIDPGSYRRQTKWRKGLPLTPFTIGSAGVAILAGALFLIF